MTTKQLRETRKIELVETHNLVLSLERLQTITSTDAWKRALYHALLMSWGPSGEERKQIREALKLP